MDRQDRIKREIQTEIQEKGRVWEMPTTAQGAACQSTTSKSLATWQNTV